MWTIVILSIYIILLLLLNLVWIRSIYNNRQTTESPIQIIGKCDQDSARNAYRNGYIAPIACPAYSNDLRVTENYNLVQRKVEQDGECCFFNPQIEDVVPAQICVSNLNVDRSTFSPQDLNQNPYGRNGGLSLNFVRAGEDFGVSAEGTLIMGKHSNFYQFSFPINGNCTIDPNWQPQTEFERVVRNSTWVPLPAVL